MSEAPPYCTCAICGHHIKNKNANKEHALDHLKNHVFRKHTREVSDIKQEFVYPVDYGMKIEQGYGKTTCKILKIHAVLLKDDPERLSTEFLQSQLGVICKKDKPITS